jgi:RNA polymerase sigma factor (sigma-70 family)
MSADQSTAVAVQPQPSSTSFDISQAIEEHLPLVQKIASAAYHRFGRNFDQDDLVGYGNLGLVRAARKFAGLEYSLREALDFSEYAQVRIWRNIKSGRDQMCRVHLALWRRMKRGEVQPVTVVTDGEAYTLADAIASDDDNDRDDIDAGSRAAEMVAWLRKHKPLWADVMELHLQGLSFDRVGERLGITANSARGHHHRAIEALQWKHNPSAYRVEDGGAAKRLSA